MKFEDEVYKLLEHEIGYMFNEDKISRLNYIIKAISKIPIECDCADTIRDLEDKIIEILEKSGYTLYPSLTSKDIAKSINELYSKVLADKDEQIFILNEKIDKLKAHIEQQDKVNDNHVDEIDKRGMEIEGLKAENDRLKLKRIRKDI